MFSEQWKRQAVIPIYKKKETELTFGNTVISQIANVSKVFERVNFNHLFSIINLNLNKQEPTKFSTETISCNPVAAILEKTLQNSREKVMNPQFKQNTLKLIVCLTRWPHHLYQKFNSIVIRGYLLKFLASLIEGREKTCKNLTYQIWTRKIYRFAFHKNLLGDFLMFPVYLSDLMLWVNILYQNHYKQQNVKWTYSLQDENLEWE